MYTIDQISKIPLHIQLFNEIKNDIISNYKIGDKLPSIRKIASIYNLSKNTVESAYSQLVAEGYIDSYPKSGYIVTDTNYSNFNTQNCIDEMKEEEKEDFLYDFVPARLEKNSFPIKLWKRLFSKAVDESLDFGGYTHSQGEFGLRVEITKYLRSSRGVKCNPNQVFICNGFADSMGLLAQMLRNKYKSLAIEHPGYHMALKVFDSYGYDIDKIALDENGINLKTLENSKSHLVYITPSHQYPTGVSIPISNRLKLLKWAKQNDALIIEDDYDSELSYANRPIPSLQGLDKFDRVVYIGTFSKSLSPALRISYMVLPNHLIEIYNTKYKYHDSSVSLMTQKTLEKFMKDGHWEKHLRKIRTLNKKKHNLMKKNLLEQLGDTMKIESQGGGLAILINPTIDFDFEKIKTLAIQKNIKIYFAKNNSGGDWDAIRMGFGGLKYEEIVPAIEIFSNIWHRSKVMF